VRQEPSAEVSAKIWHFLRGASPRWGRPNQSPHIECCVCGGVGEGIFLRTKQAKRTQRIMQAAGETALPEVLASLRNEPVPVAEGCNVRRRQYKIIR